jgi:hypothetical protein
MFFFGFPLNMELTKIKAFYFFSHLAFFLLFILAQFDECRFKPDLSEPYPIHRDPSPE